MPVPHMQPHSTPIIDQIEDIARSTPGWSPVDQLYTLFTMALLTSHLEGDILEIGSWCGRSTAAMGLAATLVGHTRIQCVDLFPAKEDWRQNADGSYSMQVTVEGSRYGGYENQTVWAEPFERDIAPIYARHSGVLEVFEDTIARYGLRHIVSAFKGTGAGFSLSPAAESFRCRLAYVDGDHSYQAVCDDILTVDRFLVGGGWICFDDAFSSYEGVNRAITELIIQNPQYEICQQMTRKCFAARKRFRRTSPLIAQLAANPKTGQ